MSFWKQMALIGMLAALAGGAMALSDEEYLKYIDAEAGRVDSVPPQSATSHATNEPKAVVGESSKDGESLSQQEFESLLRSKAKGTYSFYQSLVEKDKAEVYKAYARGASMQSVRRMVIDRKMGR